MSTTVARIEGLSDEQRDFQAAIADFCERELGTKEQRERLTNGYTELHNTEIYDKLAELGWLGVSIAEQYGGSGGGLVDACIFLEEHHARAGADRRLRGQPDRRRRLRALRHRGAEAGDPRRDRAGRVEAIAMSEPEAGSDVGALSCRAERDERRLRPQRAEDLDLRCAHRRPHPARRAHRLRRAPSTRA